MLSAITILGATTGVFPANSNAQEQCYDNLRITKNAWDTNLIKVREHVRTLQDRVTAFSLSDRQIPNISRSIGKLVVEEHLLLFQSRRMANSPINYHSSEDTLLPC